MAQIIKKNEKVVAPFFKNGVSLQFFTIDFKSSVVGKLSATVAGVRSPVTAALEAIQGVCSVEIIGVASGATMHIAVAALGGDFGTTAGMSFTDYLTSLVQAEGTLQGVDLSAATVAPFAF